MTGLVVNSHLITETEPKDVIDGWRLAREGARKTGLPIRCAAVMREFEDAPELAEISAPILWLERFMLPPWLARAMPTSQQA